MRDTGFQKHLEIVNMSAINADKNGFGERMMSYCRWSTPIPESAPGVDVSFKKMMQFCRDYTNGLDMWNKYLHKNGVQTSDAYVYESVHGGFVCHWIQDEDVHFDTAKESADYLENAKQNGKLVPQKAIDALRKEE